jgi:hypothetical protein
MNEKENCTGTISFTFGSTLKFSLEKELDELAKLANDGRLIDWKSAIVIASSYLEMCGLEILLQKDSPEELKRRFKNIVKPTRKEAKNKLERFNLFKASRLMLDYGLITQEQCTAVDSIREERNNIVHHLKSEVATECYNPRLNPEANEKYSKMVNNAKEILESLRKSPKI